MPTLSVVVPHELEKQTAVAKLKMYSLQVQDDFAAHVSHVEETWSADGVATFSFNIFGFRISGTTATRESDVHVRLQLPFAAIPIRGLIEKEIVNRVQSALQ